MGTVEWMKERASIDDWLYVDFYLYADGLADKLPINARDLIKLLTTGDCVIANLRVFESGNHSMKQAESAGAAIAGNRSDEVSDG